MMDYLQFQNLIELVYLINLDVEKIWSIGIIQIPQSSLKDG